MYVQEKKISIKQVQKKFCVFFWGDNFHAA